MLAHLVFALVVLTACGDSHGRSDGGGADASVDAGGDGLDAGSVDAGRADAGADAGSDPDAGTATACDAQRADAQVCPAALCDGPDLWYWSGDHCFSITCGACMGEDCGSGAETESACMAAHASCQPALCQTSGGTWMWWAEECGHYVCGEPAPVDCLVGYPVCDCGPGRRFDTSTGCVDDTSCPVVDPLPNDALCASTGGTWDAICCNTVCGQPCDLACAEMACDCGPMRSFDPVRGCIDDVRCHERLEGETCTEASRCEAGTICCMHCGGAGCTGDPTCQAPACDNGPDYDACGNCTTCA